MRAPAALVHKLKNPLTTLLLGIEYLKTHRLSHEELQPILEDMEEAVKQANETLRDRRHK